jgi:hypothetical protein
MRPGNQHMVILVDGVDLAAARAIAYTRAVGPADTKAVTFDEANVGAWQRLDTDIPIFLMESGGSDIARLRRCLRRMRAELADTDFLTLVVPEVLRSTGLLEILRRPSKHRLKAALLSERGVQVLDIPVAAKDGAWVDPDGDAARPPARHHVCVLVTGVNNATRLAIEYAETLQAAELRVVSFILDPEESERLANDWLDAGIPHPLEIEDSPFRDIGGSLVSYVRQRIKPDGVQRVVTVVIPERIVPTRRHQFLHGQTALLVKRNLLFERGVVVASVPYHLEDISKQSSDGDVRERE